jgi:hypothetical protein
VRGTESKYKCSRDKEWQEYFDFFSFFKFLSFEIVFARAIALGHVKVFSTLSFCNRDLG